MMVRANSACPSWATHNSRNCPSAVCPADELRHLSPKDRSSAVDFAIPQLSATSRLSPLFGSERSLRFGAWTDTYAARAWRAAKAAGTSVGPLFLPDRSGSMVQIQVTHGYDESHFMLRNSSLRLQSSLTRWAASALPSRQTWPRRASPRHTWRSSPEPPGGGLGRTAALGWDR